MGALFARLRIKLYNNNVEEKYIYFACTTHRFVVRSKGSQAKTNGQHIVANDFIIYVRNPLINESGLTIILTEEVGKFRDLKDTELAFGLIVKRIVKRKPIRITMTT